MSSLKKLENKIAVPQTQLALQRVKPQEVLSLAKKMVADSGYLLNVERGLTIKQTLKYPILKEVFRGDNGVLAYTFMSVLVTRFLEGFTFTTKLPNSQIEILISDSLERFQNETLIDVVIFFKKARKGEYGVAKKGIDANIIFGDWLPQYFEEKAIVRENDTKNRQNIQNSNVDASKVAHSYKLLAEKKAKEIKLANVKAHISAITVNADKQILEDLIFDWERCPKRKPFVHLLKLKRKIIK
ncbi:hypothetical protein [Tenacibaculum finnmarkense]|uniref:hypothetical protein n=1 Tax=Tenacibaculum finnmarkense TaxID=2781243 RepID=UPI001E4439C1|nr:hypothetical protein [Tenacibaculum finnmarkense]MCD8412755.1 hypothetical protein [Tenacibaculum finnmarkense genomovar ulcerans]